MLPAFPEFKTLDISDREDIDGFTSLYRPHSDFNFTNLWAWDTEGRRRVSLLSGNLVILFTDYLTGEPFLSFLGTEKSEDTARQLITFSERSSMPSSLRLVTEESLPGLQDSPLRIEEDPHSFDYIYSVDRFVDLNASELKEKHKLVSRCVREHPDITFELRDLQDTSVREQITSVLRRWEQRKILQNKPYSLVHEEEAINRLLASASALQRGKEIFLSCAYLKGEMIGFGIDEIAPHGYAVSHFIKADGSFRGIYEYINYNIALYLSKRGIEFWNWQQDLNIEGLRAVKSSYGPVNFLRKYTVSL